METIGKLIKSAAAAFGGLGLVVAAASNLRLAKEMMNVEFGILLTISWIILIAAIWPGKEARQIGFANGKDGRKTLAGWQKARRSFRWVILVSAVFALAAIWRMYGNVFPEKTKGPPIPPDVTVGFATPGFVQYARLTDFSPSSNRPPRLVSFGLSAQRTSYVQENGAGDPLSFRLPQRFVSEGVDSPDDPHRWDGCNRFVSNQRLVSSLRRFVQDMGREGTLRYLSNGQSLDRVVRRRALVLRDIIPTGPSEWSRVTAVSDRDLILSWLRECVGLFQPVFSIVLLNGGNDPVVVTGITYRVSRTDAGCGASELTEPLIATATYVHGLDPIYAQPSNHSSWVQYRPLDRRFGLSPHKLESFDIHLYSKQEHPLLQWVEMQLEIHTSDGIVRTPKFGLVFPLVSC